MLTQDTLLALNEWLAARPEIQIAMLYGSYARGKANPSSDIDLGIALDRALNADERIAYAQELEAVLRKSVDLVDLNQAHGLILKEIISENQFLIKRSPELFAKILLRLWFEEADFGPIREKILETRRTRVFGNQ